MAVPNIFAGTAGGTTVQLDANFAYFADAITVSGGLVGIGRTPSAAACDVQSDASGVVRVRGGTGLNQGAAFFCTSGSDTTRFAAGQSARILGGTPSDDNVIYSAGYLAFTTAGSAERMRIDASGNVLIGTSATGATNSNSTGIAPSTTGGIDFNHLLATASGVMYARFNYNGTTIGSVTQSGTAAVLFNTTSDQRLKWNIADADDAGELLDMVRVRQFDWIADGSHVRFGFVAQELVAVVPEAVHAPAEPGAMMAVDYSKLVPLLVREVQALRARVAALEA